MAQQVSFEEAVSIVAKSAAGEEPLTAYECMVFQTACGIIAFEYVKALASESSVATAKARLSIATVKARNRGAERGSVEVIADDVAVLLAAHSDLDRRLFAQPYMDSEA